MRSNNNHHSNGQPRKRIIKWIIYYYHHRRRRRRLAESIESQVSEAAFISISRMNGSTPSSTCDRRAFVHTAPFFTSHQHHRTTMYAIKQNYSQITANTRIRYSCVCVTDNIDDQYINRVELHVVKWYRWRRRQRHCLLYPITLTYHMDNTFKFVIRIHVLLMLVARFARGRTSFSLCTLDCLFSICVCFAGVSVYGMIILSIALVRCRSVVCLFSFERDDQRNGGGENEKWKIYNLTINWRQRSLNLIKESLQMYASVQLRMPIPHQMDSHTIWCVEAYTPSDFIYVYQYLFSFYSNVECCVFCH